MTVDQIVAKLDAHGFADTATQDKIDFINDVIWDICTRESWPFLEKSVDLTFNAGSATASNFPTDFDILMALNDPITGARLYPLTIEEVRDKFVTQLATTAAGPIYYYFLANTLNVYPPPAAAYTLKMVYIYFPGVVTSGGAEGNIAVPPRFHSAIWQGALSQLYDMEDDPELSDRFKQRYEKKLLDMRNDLWRRNYDRPQTIEVIDPDDFYS